MERSPMPDQTPGSAAGTDAIADCDELRAALDRAKSLLGDEIRRSPGVPGGGAADLRPAPREDLEREIRDLEEALKEAGCE